MRFFDRFSEIANDFGTLVDDCGEIISNCGSEIGDILKESKDEFVNDPVKFTTESIVEVAPMILLGGVGLKALAIRGSKASILSGITKASTSSMLGSHTIGIGGGYIAGEVAKSLNDNFLRDTITPKIGSIIYCKLLCVEHTGIYVGDGKIIHLNGSGQIESVSPNVFIKRLGGLNPAMSIYVSCSGKNAAGRRKSAERARMALGSRREYNVILDNCHQFTSGCITGNFENSDNFFWMLKDTARSVFEYDTWRVWKR